MKEIWIYDDGEKNMIKDYTEIVLGRVIRRSRHCYYIPDDAFLEGL